MRQRALRRFWLSGWLVASTPALAALHVDAGARDGGAVVIADGETRLLAFDAAPHVAAPGRVTSAAGSVERDGERTVVTSRYGLADGGTLIVGSTYTPLASGVLDVRVSVSATSRVTVWLNPTFNAVDAAHPFSLVSGDDGGALDSPDKDKNASPLPVVGVASGERNYFVASGATWDFPLPGYAVPHLVIRGSAMAAPLIGTADDPVVLVPGQDQTWRTVIGVAPASGAADRRYAVALGAQLAIAEAEGGIRAGALAADLRRAARDSIEAIAFATAYWSRVTSPDGKRSVTPAPHYAPGTWMRDSFWTVLGMAGSPLQAPTEAEILAAYARVTPRAGEKAGQVPLLIAEPSTIAFDDESGLYFLIRMDRDVHALGMKVADPELAALVLHYIMTHQVQGARFVTAGAEPFRGHPFSPNGWLDGYHYAKGDVITANQGLFVLALKAARRLGVPVEDALIQDATAAYRAAYDPGLGYMRWLSSKDYRSPDVLIPEALSLLLWDAPLLEDEPVRETLAAQVWSEHGMRVLADGAGGWVSAGEFLNTTNDGHAAEPPGWYQNGGSWMLWEYLAAYAARRHGDGAACGAMLRSLAAEVAVEPISKEFKLTRVDAGLDAVDAGGNRVLGSTDSARQGYGWNVAVLAFQRDLARRGLGCGGAERD